MKYKVLIVEDEVLIGMMIRKKLIAKGYDVYEVLPTGEQAVEMATDAHTDMILMDIFVYLRIMYAIRSYYESNLPFQPRSLILSGHVL